MIEDMEPELTEATEKNSKTDNSEVTEEANVDEFIPTNVRQKHIKKLKINI